MKLSELKPCEVCQGSISPIFYQVKVQQRYVDQRQVRQGVGLSMMLGGHVKLAEVMGPVGDLDKPLSVEVTMVLCTNCFYSRFSEVHDKLLMCDEAKVEAEKLMQERKEGRL